MDRIARVQLFIRVVETGSFSKAAAELGVTQPTATKAVAAIEQHLGARLLHRSTRGVAPTEIGQRYYEQCKRIAEALDEADSLAALQQGRLAGQLRVSSSVAFGRRVLVPLALRYMQAHPEVVLDLSFDDRYVNLVEQGVDVAIRMGRLADSSLGARFLGRNPWLLVAAPAYLAQRGAPADAAELITHACLVYSSVQGDDRWTLRPPGGVELSMPVRGPLRSNNLSAVLEACCAGLGLAALPLYVARHALEDGRLQPVLADHALPAQDIHAVFPSPRLVPAKVTHFIEFVRGAMAAEGWPQA